MYDFREGLLLDQSVYKDNTCDWKAAFLYILAMLVCYAWGFGWWYLFYYLYGTYQKSSFGFGSQYSLFISSLLSQ